MRLLIDVNVILNDIQQRGPAAAASSQVIDVCRSAHEAFVAWHTLSIIHYISRRCHGSASAARDDIRDLLTWATVAPVSHAEALAAEALPMSDFEDAMQSTAACAAKADFIISDNEADFAQSPVPCLTPDHFLLRFHPDSDS